MRRIRLEESWCHSLLLAFLRRKASRGLRDEAGEEEGGEGSVDRRRLESWNETAALFVDHVLGLALAGWVWQHRATATARALEAVDYVKHDLVIRSMSVLDGEPGGLKLYDDLSRFFSQSSVVAIEWAWRPEVLEWTVSACVHLLIVLWSALGMEGGFAFATDALFLLSSPCLGLFFAYSLALRAHLRMSREMYRLFRGKWQREAKQVHEESEADEKDFVLEHVIVGVLLLTPLVFLFPTVLVYYAFWLVAFFGVKITLLGVQVLMLGARIVPLASVWLRFWRPQAFQRGRYLEIGEGGSVVPKPCYASYAELALGPWASFLILLVAEVAKDLGKILKGEGLRPLFVI